MAPGSAHLWTPRFSTSRGAVQRRRGAAAYPGSMVIRALGKSTKLIRRTRPRAQEPDQEQRPTRQDQEIRKTTKITATKTTSSSRTRSREHDVTQDQEQRRRAVQT